MLNDTEILIESEAEAVIQVEDEAVDIVTESVEAAEACAEDAPEAPSESEQQPEAELSTDELTALREEISSLRAELENRDRALARMHDELSEFSELYPDRTLTSLPSEVWEGVRSGLPLAASVAYFEAKQRRREAIAAEVNQRNSAASSGGIDGAGIDYYSPDEVRAMNAAQVRQNYSKILDSMKLWN